MTEFNERGGAGEEPLLPDPGSEDGEREFDRILLSLSVLTPSEGFAQRVMARVGSEVHPAGALLDGHADGALLPDIDDRVRLHVAGCPECRAVVEGVRAVRAGVAALPRLNPSEGFAARVSAAALALHGRPAPQASAADPVRGAVPVRKRTHLRVWAAALIATPLATSTFLVVAIAALLLRIPAVVSAGDLVSFLAWRIQDGAGALLREIALRVLDTGVALALPPLLTLVRGEPAVAAMLVLGVCLAFVLSVWILYRNVFHSSEGSLHVHPSV
jgi:hypothetical protein